VLNPRPAWDDPEDLAEAVRRHQAGVWALLCEPNVHVYPKGLMHFGEQFDAALAEATGSAEDWAKGKAEINAAGRRMALLY
jgi:hypothetical protein